MASEPLPSMHDASVQADLMSIQSALLGPHTPLTSAPISPLASARSHHHGSCRTNQHLPVGVGHGILPYVHESFPKTQKLPIGTSKYYTMRSVHKSPRRDGGKRKRARQEGVLTHDSGDVSKDVLSLKLPELRVDDVETDRNSKGYSPFNNSTKYIKNVKTTMKMKGIHHKDSKTGNNNNNKQAWSTNSSETKLPELPQSARMQTIAELKDEVSVGGVENENDNYMPSLVDYNNDITTNGHLTSRDSIKGDIFPPPSEEEELSVNREKSELEKHFEGIMVGYKNTPGFRTKRKDYGRKLGNVVSSHRMNQLLDSKEPLRMENFFNLYQ